MENEIEKKDDTSQSQSSGSPLLLGVVGLLLVVGGWKVSSWTLPHREDGLLSELRRLADDELRDKIDRYDQRYRPLEWPGRLAFFAGLGCFVVAGVRMNRSPEIQPDTEEKNSRISTVSAPSKND
ncbi:MAG: hypothetical protein EBV06_12170 [Planctomycetia bacterium]|nr:hypothetical protein [Planctomycetia bacterium]